MSDERGSSSLESQSNENYRNLLKSDEFRNAFNETLWEFSIIVKDIANSFFKLIHWEDISEVELDALKSLFSIEFFTKKLLLRFHIAFNSKNVLHFIRKELEFYPIKKAIENWRKWIEWIIKTEVLLSNQNFDVIEIWGFIYIYYNQSKNLLQNKFKINELWINYPLFLIRDYNDIYRSNDWDYLLMNWENLLSIKRWIIIEKVREITKIRIIDWLTIIQYKINATHKPWVIKTIYYCLETWEDHNEWSEIALKFNVNNTRREENDIDVIFWYPKW